MIPARALSTPETPLDPQSAFRAALVQAAEACGFAHAAYMHLGYQLTRASQEQATPQDDHTATKTPSMLVSSGGLDEALYRKRGYLAFDLLAERAATAFTPFCWSLADLAAPSARPLARALDAWGVRAGVIAPIQDSIAGPAFVNFFGSGPFEPLLADREIRDGQILLAAARLHAAARTTLPPSSPAEGELNAREIHVLRLAAQGLTEMETATELRLSRRGVQFHLSRAGAKLATPNKTAAVARAITLGLIRSQ
ncbi:helix-turn-helix transcriptional regulator [Caulobacter endophyticus]|uniref:helix-turn-helix transcriptional regulator n=1 Tax=Caulobacter endophyticus TaxID=2172652 RepID=UPI0024100075|nr:autoinducer binding domain-containing protein [Caulobacter endophyticus]MDG2527249.1 autoinducer binding domain-containing protein [Caulobacter endophyticus]